MFASGACLLLSCTALLVNCSAHLLAHDKLSRGTAGLDNRQVDHIAGFFNFHSDPDILSPRPEVKLRTSNPSLLQSGFLLVVPTGTWENEFWHSFGPHIYTDQGDLVWNGQSIVAESSRSIDTANKRCQNFHVCNCAESGGLCLCWSENEIVDNHHLATNRIFGPSYEPFVRDIGQVGSLSQPQGHDFRIIEQGRAVLQLVNEKRQFDLTGYSGLSDGWIYDACFQQVDLQTHRADFEWCASDSFGLDDTYIYLRVPENLNDKVNYTSSIAGNGSWHMPWDLFHMNSIDYTSEKDYIVSIRHLDQVIKIAGLANAHGLEPGSIIWRLGGKRSDFEIEDQAMFSRQHNPSSISIRHDEEDILLFDNDSDGFNPPRVDFSSAKLLRLNNESMTATLLQTYDQPDTLSSSALGSAQKLPNGNVLVGWGHTPQTSEFAFDGELLLHLEFSPVELPNSYAKSYRSQKSKWVGLPKWPPKILAYRQSCTSPLAVYTSWNGATEVHSWLIQVKAQETESWTRIGMFVKKGFETKTVLEHASPYVQYVSAQPLDRRGNPLFQDTWRQVWIPALESTESSKSLQCSAHGCLNQSTVVARFTYPDLMNNIAACPTGQLNQNSSPGATILGLAVLCATLAIILCSFWYFGMFRKTSTLHLPDWLSTPFRFRRFVYRPLEQSDTNELHDKQADRLSVGEGDT